MSDVTRLLDAAAADDRKAAADLLPRVYDELTRMSLAEMETARSSARQSLVQDKAVHA